MSAVYLLSVVSASVAVLLAFYVLGVRHGFSREEVQGVATQALEPVGPIILVTGAGGVFGQVLIETGIGDALANVMRASNLPVVVLAFAAAALVRVSLGSATVSMVTAAGIVAPAIEGAGFSVPLTGLVVIAIASGATAFSHVNDSGFWLVGRYLGISEEHTLQSWTAMVTIVGLVGFSTALLIGLLL